MLMAIKERTDIGVDSASAEDYVKAFGWDGETGKKEYPDLEIAEKAIFYREENDDTGWELMKELAN